MGGPSRAANPEVPLVQSRLSLVATAVIVLVIAAACTTTGVAPSASAPSIAPSVAASLAPPSAAASVAASPSATASAIASAPGSGSASGAPATTTIDWGVIWDTLPASFPQFPGAHPTVTGGGPASAILDVPAEASVASTWFQTALTAAGFSIVGTNGPREDGSYNIVATRGSADCHTEISLAPLGTTTTATIYLAAACPFS
jgi:hypothetical protein